MDPQYFNLLNLCLWTPWSNYNVKILLLYKDKNIKNNMIELNNDLIYILPQKNV
ncbi:hypothetical protein rpr22_0888 [Rickettsia prowazekii str. Rp22]|uniref:Uncharacterized protein n=1 Tax=Rickettsia prowazekii (strain Rp22) TaxID=449216 RepID=D5AYA9_RICPP|nr:hypothetical protein rpr22_0888 [Rickettsia prowazekii str. Rp22]AGJ01506.1 Undecaprenyl-phosphate alpha-N-acetylglucosaminyltransferase [Rickettsia prowazekii str. NMRC Madrid E]AGJ02920.1 hypothetical protein H375_6950 [Rickettsia prowazekii str. Breinl]AMS12701.1 UDP-phosphate N-acetylglucosaminyl 1-phosphate transferase [Rickettsia prowazekii]EOB09397.1 hypothetical protein H377_7010 [Rickettsia prowazekii str. Cairo 3]EOB10246.1 Undecaprenyl-phosphate alpha-N-acetylglucosaminyltransfer